MIWIDTVFWWVGAMACGLGTLLAVCLIVTWPIALVWKKCGDMRALFEVVIEANRQGRYIFGQERNDK